MDHFNITVAKDGALVATRRGLQVSKQKHKGLSFVNSSAPDNDAASRPTAARGAPATASSVDLGLPLVRRWRFVTKDTEPRKAAAAKTRPKPKSDAASGKGSQARKGSRRAAPHTTSYWTPTPNSSSSDSDRDIPAPPAAYYNFNLGPGHVQGAEHPTPSLPEWTTVRLPLCERDQRLFYNFFVMVPRKMYPLEDYFTFNPARSPEFFWAIVNDPAAIHCVLMCNSMFRSVLSGKMDSDELAYRISKICAIINRQLGEMPKKIPNITLECITTLALMGVRRPKPLFNPLTTSTNMYRPSSAGTITGMYT